MLTVQAALIRPKGDTWAVLIHYFVGRENSHHKLIWNLGSGVELFLVANEYGQKVQLYTVDAESYITSIAVWNLVTEGETRSFVREGTNKQFGCPGEDGFKSSHPSVVPNIVDAIAAALKPPVAA
jgi:hypothetical protein